jgi:poly(hydroxyalkanoate) depolymerase family esterase
VLALVGAIALVGTVGAAPNPNPTGEGVFLSGNLRGRAYRLYVPPTRGDSAAAPLVVALHGCWQTAEDFATGTRLNRVAAERGLFVLYPIQSRRDNANRCWNWFEPENATVDRGELAEILALVEEVRRQRNVDGSRVTVLGFSAGAFMAVNLACAAPDSVAGVGVAAGGPFRCGAGALGGFHCMRGLRLDPAASATACQRAAGGRTLRHIRVSLWHGAGDTVVSPANLAALATMFVQVIGAGEPVSADREGATRSVYSVRGKSVLETWLVAGMEHAWSGGDPRGTHTFPPGPRASEHMLEFLIPRD